MICFLIGAIVCYLAVVIIILERFYFFIKTISQDESNVKCIFLRKKKILVFCLILGALIFLFLSSFTLQIKARTSFLLAVKESAINCILPFLKLRNLILLGMFFFLLYYDKRRNERSI